MEKEGGGGMSVATAGDDWMELADCVGAPPEWFFPPSPEQGRKWSSRDAKLTCAQCPVIAKCFRYAMLSQNLGEVGVWGHATEVERRVMRQFMPIFEQMSDGELAAYLVKATQFTSVAPAGRRVVEPPRR